MAEYKIYKQMSGHQRRYADFIAANPGCSIADIDRACRVNRQAGHKWVYDGVNRLVARGVITKQRATNKTKLYIRKISND